MASTFITPTIVARETNIRLLENMVMASLVNRSVESDFTASKVGDAVTVRIPATFVGQEFSGSVVDQEVIETSTQVVLNKTLDVSVPITHKELTLDLADFNAQITEGVAVALAEKLSAEIFASYSDVYNWVGTAADPLDSIADVADVNKKFGDLKIPTANRKVIIDTLTERDMLANIPELIKTNERGDTQGLKEATLGRVMKADYFVDQAVPTHVAGTMQAQTPAVNGAVSAGATSMAVDGGVGTETIKKGDLFTVAGVTGQFVFTEDQTATGGAIASVAFSPAAPAGGFADDAAITMVATHKVNLAFHPNAIALAVVPPALPLGTDKAAVSSFRDMSVRTVFEYDSNAKKDRASWDFLVGVKVVDPRLIFRILG